MDDFENNKYVRTFTLEGNIGAGKSTFVKIVKSNLNVDSVLEPLDKWLSVGLNGDNFLEMFYKDTPRWAYTFQTYAFITRVQTQRESLLKDQTKSVQLLERSIYCDRYCFAKNCYELGLMSELEWNLYKEWFTYFTTYHISNPTGIIYLRTTPEVCNKRIIKRARNEDATVPFDYLKSLHDKHEKWLIHKEDIEGNLSEVPVLVLDCDLEFETDLEVQKDFLNKVQNFFELYSTSQVKNVESSKFISKEI